MAVKPLQHPNRWHELTAELLERTDRGQEWPLAIWRPLWYSDKQSATNPHLKLRNNRETCKSASDRPRNSIPASPEITAMRSGPVKEQGRSSRIVSIRRHEPGKSNRLSRDVVLSYDESEMRNKLSGLPLVNRNSTTVESERLRVIVAK